MTTPISNRPTNPPAGGDRESTAIVSATRTNAELFGLDHRIGTVEPGKDADLVLVRGAVLDRLEAVTESQSIALVVKGGEIVRELATLERVPIG